MKVEKVVGWVTGRDGTGNIFEVSDNGKFYLATIWQDGSFHPISAESVKQHISEGKGKLESDKIYSTLSNGPISISNPVGWERIYKPVSTETDTETDISDTLEIPVSVSFEGKIKFNIGGFSKILNLLN